MIAFRCQEHHFFVTYQLAEAQIILQKMNISNFVDFCQFLVSFYQLTHCYSALCQWLNDFILIWFIEFKPFSVDRLNNCIFRELDQHESGMIQEVIDYIHIKRNVVTIENCRQSEKKRFTCLIYSNSRCTSYLYFLRCLCQREMYCPLGKRTPATDYANKLPAPNNLAATWTSNTV